MNKKALVLSLLSLVSIFSINAGQEEMMQQAEKVRQRVQTLNEWITAQTDRLGKRFTWIPTSWDLRDSVKQADELLDVVFGNPEEGEAYLTLAEEVLEESNKTKRYLEKYLGIVVDSGFAVECSRFCRPS